VNFGSQLRTLVRLRAFEGPSGRLLEGLTSGKVPLGRGDFLQGRGTSEGKKAGDYLRAWHPVRRVLGGPQFSELGTGTGARDRKAPPA
jgi:hypothetical protein